MEEAKLEKRKRSQDLSSNTSRQPSKRPSSSSVNQRSGWNISTQCGKAPQKPKEKSVKAIGGSASKPSLNANQRVSKNTTTSHSRSSQSAAHSQRNSPKPHHISGNKAKLNNSISGKQSNNNSLDITVEQARNLVAQPDITPKSPLEQSFGIDSQSNSVSPKGKTSSVLDSYPGNEKRMLIFHPEFFPDDEKIEQIETKIRKLQSKDYIRLIVFLW